jgi:hypothetical protein
MMPVDDVLAVIGASAPELAARYGVTRLAVFGSAARGELRPDSDVDVLVEFRESTFDNYMGLKFDLIDLLGRSVDLVTVAALKPRLRERILAEACDVA